MVTIEGNEPFIQPPEWALLERSLIDLMDDSVEPLLERYVRPDGTILWPTTDDFQSIDGLDDAYESFHNWPLFYALGGADKLRDLSQRQWEAITRQFARYDCGHGHPMVVKEFEQGYDWMHQGEGHVFFYLLGLADPDNAGNAERAQRFAGFYLNEDPEALNYDADKRLIKCAHNGSMGPAYRNMEAPGRTYQYEQWKPWPLPFLDIPGCEVVEDLKKPGIPEQMAAAMAERMGRGDVAANLAITSLVTNAYLYTGEEKYRSWVREYVDAWIERTRSNHGILPDNVGLSGRIGEYMDGKWYGGYYGWSWPHGWHHLSDACISAAENLTVLYGDLGYMDFPRSQVQALVQQAAEENGVLRVPHFYNDRGWDGFAPFEARHMAHIWCASMGADDLELSRRLRNHESGECGTVRSFFTKHGGGHEAPWLAYLAGEYPDYPLEILRHNHAQVYQRLAFMRDDQQDPSTYGDWYLQVRNPITAEGLVQLTMGGPLNNYNGGLLMVRLRYFDAVRRRPGLPEDVAALVESLEEDRAVVHLVNLSATRERQVVVQGGAYGEHQFTQVRYGARQQSKEPGSHATEQQYRAQVANEIEERAVSVDDRCFSVRLQPGAQVRLDLGMRRFANQPTYALPW